MVQIIWLVEQTICLVQCKVQSAEAWHLYDFPATDGNFFFLVLVLNYAIIFLVFIQFITQESGLEA